MVFGLAQRGLLEEKALGAHTSVRFLSPRLSHLDRPASSSLTSGLMRFPGIPYHNVQHYLNMCTWGITFLRTREAPREPR